MGDQAAGADAIGTQLHQAVVALTCGIKRNRQLRGAAAHAGKQLLQGRDRQQARVAQALQPGGCELLEAILLHPANAIH